MTVRFAYLELALKSYVIPETTDRQRANAEDDDLPARRPARAWSSIDPL